MYIIVELIKYNAKRATKLLAVFAIGLLMIASIIYIKYKPSYKVTVNGEEVGYVNNIEYMQKMIEDYKKDCSGNVAYINISQMPKYELALIDRKQLKDNSDEVLTAVKNNSYITYKSYAILINGKEKAKVSSEAEAKEILNALNNTDRKLAKISEVLTSESKTLRDVKSLEVAKAELEADEVKPKKTVTKKSSKKVTKTTKKSKTKKATVKKVATKKTTAKKATKKTATKKKSSKKTTKKTVAKVTTRKSSSRKTKTTTRSTVKRTSKYTFPVKGCSKKNILTKHYPSYAGHTGIDININVKGKSVVAADSGTVIESGALRTSGGSYKSYGEYIMIKHNDGTVTLYGHLKQGSRKVKKGDKVTRGQVIAKVGSTGNSTGTHLHFEVRINGKPVNPLNYL